MDAFPNAAALPAGSPTFPDAASSSRLLPWSSFGGKPCYLVTDDASSRLSLLADDVEDQQLEAGAEVLDRARAVLGDTMSPYGEVRYAGIRLAECLSDALRVAESRGMRLPYVSDEDEEEDDGPDDGAGLTEHEAVGRDVGTGDASDTAAPRRTEPNR